MSRISTIQTSRENRAKGFTVVELLVATVVFGVVLLAVTTAILQFTRVYYKGVTEAKTQDTARSVADGIAQSIQFNSQSVTATPPRTPGVKRAFCVGNQQYTYILGWQIFDGVVGANQTHHALVVRDLPGCQATSPQPVMSDPNTKTELLAPRMRLARMEVAPVGTSTSLYKITIRVVYGDDDLLTDPLAADASCKNAYSGTQFCAVSEITTVVTKRLE